ncbi:MAG: citrate lyase holo-[acyl-carrier protein] synthase, partial [Angelakisella sp.]
TIKHICVTAEEKIHGGRMLDIDVMDSSGTPVGRSQLGLPPRCCFVCHEPAAVCVSRRLHPTEEILRRAHELLEEAKK